MPIEFNPKIKPISEDQFYSIDHEIMTLVFSIHKDLGRFYNEKIYQNELAYRIQDSGLGTVNTEVPIRVSYDDFFKTYYIDLLIIDAIPYELKTSETLTGVHSKQILNYLLLTGLQNGKLINMRPPSVQHRFISTKISPDKRLKFTIEEYGWKNLDGDSVWLKNLVEDLLSEWGTFLDTNLFYEALIHFRGGEEHVLKRIEIFRDFRIVGTQKVHLLNPETAFNVSAITRNRLYYKQHLQRFLDHTRLRAIHWINFNHHIIEFETIFR